VVTGSLGARVGVLLLASGLLGCSARRELDRTVGQMLEALVADDYRAFEPIAHPALRRHLPPRTFRVLSRSFQRLGGLKGRSMIGFQLSSDGTTRGNYTLSFPGGGAILGVTYKDSEIRDVDLGGQPLLDAMKAVRAEGFGKLGVVSFQWLDAQGHPETTFVAGERIRFHMRAGGLDLDKKRRYAVTASVLVMNSVGRVVHDEPLPQKSGKVAPHEPPVATLEGALTIKWGGSYRADFTLADTNVGQTFEHSEALTIQGPAEAPPDAGPDTGTDAREAGARTTKEPDKRPKKR